MQISRCFLYQTPLSPSYDNVFDFAAVSNIPPGMTKRDVYKTTVLDQMYLYSEAQVVSTKAYNVANRNVTINVVISNEWEAMKCNYCALLIGGKWTFFFITNIEQINSVSGNYVFSLTCSYDWWINTISEINNLPVKAQRMHKKFSVRRQGDASYYVNPDYHYTPIEKNIPIPQVEQTYDPFVIYLKLILDPTHKYCARNHITLKDIDNPGLGYNSVEANIELGAPEQLQTAPTIYVPLCAFSRVGKTTNFVLMEYTGGENETVVQTSHINMKPFNFTENALFSQYVQAAFITTFCPFAKEAYTTYTNIDGVDNAVYITPIDLDGSTITDYGVYLFDSNTHVWNYKNMGIFGLSTIYNGRYNDYSRNTKTLQLNLYDGDIDTTIKRYDYDFLNIDLIIPMLPESKAYPLNYYSFISHASETELKSVTPIKNAKMTAIYQPGGCFTQVEIFSQLNKLIANSLYNGVSNANISAYPITQAQADTYMLSQSNQITFRITKQYLDAIYDSFGGVYNIGSIIANQNDSKKSDNSTKASQAMAIGSQINNILKRWSDTFSYEDIENAKIRDMQNVAGIQSSGAQTSLVDSFYSDHIYRLHYIEHDKTYIEKVCFDIYAYGSVFTTFSTIFNREMKWYDYLQGALTETIADKQAYDELSQILARGVRKWHFKYSGYDYTTEDLAENEIIKTFNLFVNNLPIGF